MSTELASKQIIIMGPFHGVEGKAAQYCSQWLYSTSNWRRASWCHLLSADGLLCIWDAMNHTLYFTDRQWQM